MQEYIHRTKYEIEGDTVADANGGRLFNGIAIAMFGIVGKARSIYATAFSPHRTAQDVILNDFASLNLRNGRAAGSGTRRVAAVCIAL